MCHEHKNKEIRVMHNENYNYGLQRCKSEGCRRILVLLYTCGTTYFIKIRTMQYTITYSYSKIIKQ